MTHAKHTERDNNFNLLRLLLATTVLLGHAYEMAYNDRSHEPFAVFTGTSMSLGDVAVDGFFLISGFLILKSWLHGPRLGVYLAKRVLRIVPGYIVAALLSTLVVGWGVTHSFHYLRQLTWRYPVSLALLDSPITPVFFPQKTWGWVNGSLWTIKYEFRCYLLIAAAGMLGLFRRRWPWLLFTFAGLTIANFPWLEQHLTWHRWLLVLGDPNPMFRLWPAFLCGGCYFLLWKYIPRRPWMFLLVLAFLTPLLFHQQTVEPAWILLGGYLIFYFAFMQIPALNAFKKSADLSYGIYLYGWPVEALWTWYLHTAAWITFLGSLAIVVPLAWLSWHFVERPALEHKPKTSVPLPDSPTVRAEIP